MKYVKYMCPGILLGFVPLACFLAASPAAAAEANPQQPNIVFIMVDDMGYGDLSCYGQQTYQTPNLDRMAAEGIRFTEAYSGCTVCAPARSTLMTGHHMGHTSVRGNTGGIPLRDEDVTVAEVLGQAGYAVGGFGKWGLGDLETPGVPEQQGFDRFFGYYHQIHAHDYFPEYLIDTGKKVPLEGEHAHYRIVAEMKTWITEHRAGPFFCYAAWTPPHARYQFPQDDPFYARVKDKPWPKNTKGHAAFNLMIDHHVGEVLELLKELGIDKQTIVFFCSDNGASLRNDGTLDSSGPLTGQKRSMHEGGLRVPQIARWPGRIERDRVTDLPTYFPDVMPTLAELAGAEKCLPAGIDGVSIVPELTGRKQTGLRQRTMYWEWPKYNWGKREYTGLMQAVRRGNWKMLRHDADRSWELYDLSQDIAEKNNLAEDRPEVVKRLDAWVDENRVPPREQQEPASPPGRRFR